MPGGLPGGEKTLNKISNMPTNKIEVVATRGKIRIDNSDGSFTELGFAMPYEIAEKIMISIMAWEDEWVATTNVHNEYQKVANEFRERQKIKE